MEPQDAQASLEFAEDARRRLRSKFAEALGRELEQRYPELTAAFEQFVSAGLTDGALRLASALVPFWMSTKRIDQGDRWFERALEASRPGDPARARALYEHGYLIFWAGHDERSSERSREAVAAARRSNEPTVVALALAVLARIALRTDVEEAKRLLREALAETSGTDDIEGRSSAMHVLGVAHQMSGEFEEARRVMSERIALGRESGNDFLVAVESANLSMVERQLGNLEAAEGLSRTSLATFHRLGDELAVAWSANGLAAVTAARGDLLRAATLLGFAEAGIERAGGEWPPDERAQYDETLASLHAGLDRLDLDRAWAIGRGMSTSDAMADVRSAPSTRPPGP